jgi:DNA-binding NarL/FixJ family response regulator
MSESPDESTVLIVDPLPLRNLGLVAVLDRLAGGRKLRLASLTPEDAQKWIAADANCGMIIYNVGSASIADHKHLKRIKALRARAAEAPLVIFSDNDSRKEISSALNAGAQGFLYAGTNAQMALQALSFIFKGGSYFPAAVQPTKRGRANHAHEVLEFNLPPTEYALGEERAGEGSGDDGTSDGRSGTTEDTVGEGSTHLNLTERQKSVLVRLGHGDSNKAIARRLGIREGTVKVHVRQIMRKLGVANRTQVALACAGGAGVATEARTDERGVNGRPDMASGPRRFSVSLAAEGKA